MKTLNTSSLFIQLLACAVLLTSYLVMIHILRTEPFSDFLSYYLAARDLRDGGELSNFYKYFQAPGYPYLLAALFSLFGSDSIIIPQILNAATMTCISLVLMHHDLSQSASLRLLTFLVTAFNLNYTPMIPVLCSEIPFALFFVTGVVVLWHVVRLMEQPGTGAFTVRLLAAAAGVSLGISQGIRPVTIPLMLVFSGVYLVAGRILGKRAPAAAARRGKPQALGAFASLWVGLAVTAASVYACAGYGLTLQPFQKGIWNVYVGFNHQSKGTWNETDARRIWPIGEGHNWDAAHMNRDLPPLVIARVKQNWKAQFSALPQKMAVLLNPAPIPDWAILKSAVRDATLMRKAGLCFAVMNLTVILASSIGLLSILIRGSVSTRERFGAAMTAAVLIYMLLHAYFLEVQPRYANHLWLILFWLFTLNLVNIRHACSRVTSPPT